MVERERSEKIAAPSPVMQWLVAAVLAALVSYFTTVAAIQSQLAEAKSTETSHFAEVLRRLDVMQADLRELRSNGRNER